MSENFTRPNTSQTEKIVAETLTGQVGSYEQMKEALRANLGIASPSEETPNYSMRPEPVQEALLPVQSLAEQKYSRVIYPSGNNRFEIYGSSEGELDQRESQLRAMFAR